jgi:hypothetical protein
MFHTGDERLRAIEEENLRWRRRILGGFLRRLARAIIEPLRAPLVALARRTSSGGQRCRADQPGCAGS